MSFKHYLPGASAAEERLLADLAIEFPTELATTSRQGQDGTYQIIFETSTLPMVEFIWHLLSDLKAKARHAERCYQVPPAGERALCPR